MTQFRVILIVLAVVAVAGGLAVGAYTVLTPDAPEGLKPVPDIQYEHDNNHLHGLGYDSENDRLYLATHFGLFMEEDDQLYQVGDLRDDLMGFSLAPQDPPLMLASGHPQQGGNLGLIKSTDGGFEWEQIFQGVAGETVDFHTMVVHPADPDLVLGSFHGDLYRSEDGGHSFEILQESPPAGFCWNAPCLAPDPSDSGRFLAGTGQGVFLTTDRGIGWTRLSAGATAGVGVDPDDPQRVLAFREQGLMLSEDGGESWDQVEGRAPVDPGDAVFGFAFDSNSDRVYAGTMRGSILISTDRGNTWEQHL